MEKFQTPFIEKISNIMSTALEHTPGFMLLIAGTGMSGVGLMTGTLPITAIGCIFFSLGTLFEVNLEIINKDSLLHRFDDWFQKRNKEKIREEQELKEIARQIRFQIKSEGLTADDFKNLDIGSVKQLKQENEKLRKQLQAVPNQTKIQEREIKEEAEMSMSM